jgi:hypothetical protein
MACAFRLTRRGGRRTMAACSTEGSSCYGSATGLDEQQPLPTDIRSLAPPSVTCPSDWLRHW